MRHANYYAASASCWREHYGMPFEAFAVGQRFKHRPGLTLSQRDNVEEALDTFNAAMLHYDAHYAAQTTWKKPLMVSTTTVQRVIGMTNKTYGDRAAIIGFDEIALTAPLFDGDTIYAESEIVALEASEGATGTVVADVRALKADGTVVARLRTRFIVHKAGCGPDSPKVPCDPDPRFAAYWADADGVLTEQVGLFFEEFRPGDTFIHAPRRSFFQHECIDYGRRAFDADPHTQDLAYIAAHQGGRVRVPETFLLGAATAPSTRTFGRVVANLGWRDIRLPHPVFAGDTIEVSSKVLDARGSKSRPDEGILTVETRAALLDGRPVVSYMRNLLVYRRQARTPYGDAGY